MRIYIKKNTKKTLTIYKETLFQCIISDILSALVMTLLIGLDITFSIYVTHSFILDVVIIVLFIAYVVGITNKKYEVKTKEELQKVIDEIFE
jgi:hypothetical protein